MYNQVILEKNMEIIFVIIDLLSLKIVRLRMIIVCFGTLRMHQIVPFYQTRLVCNSLSSLLTDLLKALKNTDQI